MRKKDKEHLKEKIATIILMIIGFVSALLLFWIAGLVAVLILAVDTSAITLYLTKYKEDEK